MIWVKFCQKHVFQYLNQYLKDICRGNKAFITMLLIFKNTEKRPKDFEYFQNFQSNQISSGFKAVIL